MRYLFITSEEQIAIVTVWTNPSFTADWVKDEHRWTEGSHDLLENLG